MTDWNSPRFKRDLDKWIMRGPPEYSDECERCHETIDPSDPVFSINEDMVCRNCWEGRGNEDGNSER